MSSAVFTPKQVAEALGVSESSVKRWVDSGRLNAARTVGGHRKVPMASLAEFVRSTGHLVANPDVVGMAPISSRRSLESLQEDLFTSMTAGDEKACRNLVLGAYQRGESLADLGDRLIGPAFKRVGDGWEAGQVAIRDERRSCEVIMSTLHELRRWIAVPPLSAPLAVVATPLSDFAEVPARLVELTLLSSRLRVEMAGSGLPLEEIRDAVLAASPTVFCLSVTHLTAPDEFVAECNEKLMRPLAEANALRPNDEPLHRLVGGGALNGRHDGPGLECELHGTSLGVLAAYVAEIAA